MFTDQVQRPIQLRPPTPDVDVSHTGPTHSSNQTTRPNGVNRMMSSNWTGPQSATSSMCRAPPAGQQVRTGWPPKPWVRRNSQRLDHARVPLDDVLRSAAAAARHAGRVQLAEEGISVVVDVPDHRHSEASAGDVNERTAIAVPLNVLRLLHAQEQPLASRDAHPEPEREALIRLRVVRA